MERSRGKTAWTVLPLALAGAAGLVPWSAGAQSNVSFKLIRNWRIEGGELWPLAFSPDGTRIACSAFRSEGLPAIEIYDTATGERRQTFPVGAGRPYSVQFSPDDSLLAVGVQTGGADGAAGIQIWDRGNGHLKHSISVSGQAGEAIGVAFSPDGRTVAAGGRRGAVRLIDAQTGAEKRVLPGLGDNFSTFSVAFSPDGRTLASVAYPTRLEYAGGGPEIEPFVTSVRLWNPETGDLKRTLETNSHRAHQLAFSRDGATLAITCDFGMTQLWNPETGELKRTLGEGWWMHPHEVADFKAEEGLLKGRITGKDPYLVLPLQHLRAAEIKQLKIRMRVTGGTFGELFWATASSPTFGPDKRLAFKITGDGEFHDVVLPVGEHPEWKSEVFTLRLDPNQDAPNTQFAIESITGVGENEQPLTLRVGNGNERGLVRSAAFMPDLPVLVAGSWGVVLWDTQTGNRVGTVPGEGRLTRLSPDGKLLAAGGPDRQVLLWKRQ